MKALRNVVRFCVVGLSVSALGAGCSDGGGTPPLGQMPTTAGTGNTTGGTPPVGTAGTGGSAATTAGTGGTGQTTGGTGTGGTGTGGTTGGTGLTTAGTGGTTGGTGTGGTTGGTGTGGTGGTTGGTGGTTGGTGGTTGGTGTGGTGGGTDVGFPQGCNAPTGTHSTTALTRSCWSTKASDCTLSAQNMNPPKQAIDADATTRFSTGKKMLAGTAFTFEVDLGAAVMIDGIAATSNATDYAPSLMVSVSTDGTNFTNVACGTGAMVTDFSFPAVSAKVVRLTQYGVIDKWWSVLDFNVYGTGTTCAGGAGTPTDMCTTQHNTGAE